MRTWRHTRKRDRFVAVILDLTGISESTDPCPIAAQSRRPLQAGLQSSLTDAQVLDPLNVVRRAGDALDAARRTPHTDAGLLTGKKKEPAPLSEVITLSRTLKHRAVDVLDDFDRPGTAIPQHADQGPVSLCR
jgi:hypothetical protein